MASARTPYLLALIVVATAATVCALLGWQVSMVAICVAGLPVVFGVYAASTGSGKAFRRPSLAAAGLLALGLGVAWARIAGPITADGYRAALGGRMEAWQVLLCGVAIPATYGLVLLAPAALVRIANRTRGSWVDGFIVGAAGAFIVNAAASAILLAPQFRMGLSATSQPVSSLLVEAVVEGLVWPLVSAAVGGIFGIALWRRGTRAVVVAAAILAGVIFPVAMGIVDVSPLALDPYVVVQLLISVAALLAARRVVTTMMRHVRPPVGTATFRSVMLRVMAGVGAAVAIAIMVAVLLKPAPPAYICPPDCGGPPTGKPVETNPRYSGDNGAFSVAYPGAGTAYEVTFDPPGINGVRLKYVGGDTGTMTLFGEPSGGRPAKQIALDILRHKYPAASVSYEIPNASVGYEPGYGVVADVYPRGTSSTSNRLRVIVMAAVKHDYALIATAAGPYHEFSPDYGPGHPSAANLEVAMDMGKYVNSFRWYGDRFGRPS